MTEHSTLFRALALHAAIVISSILVTAVVSVAHAATEPLFKLQRATTSIAPHHASDSRTNFKLDKSLLANLSKGEVLSVALPDQRLVNATVVKLDEVIKGVEDKHTVLSIEGGAGSIEIVHQRNGSDQVRIADTLGTIKLYQAALGLDGEGELVKQNPHAEYCIDMPVEPRSPIQSSNFALLQAAPALTENELQQLQSKPGASKVIFINYWGGTLSGTAWNAQFTSNADIVYTPYSRDGNTADFSSNERDLMWLGWREAAEDYAPFSVNVTTDINVYQATPSANRAMLIATTTSAWYGGGGGVAFAFDGAFGNDYYSTGWVWNSSAGSLGQTISHEAGHIMGLGHDGTTTGGSYYGGHGSWGPIMGAPFNHAYVQWSKGEYPNANNTEDDLTIIANVLGEDADIIGDSIAAALLISSNTQLEGVIEPLGLFGGMDTDVISFQLGSQQAVNIDVAPLLSIDGEQYGTNLSMDAVLSDGVTTIAQSDISANPQTNILQYFGELNAGTYYLYISALTPDISWTTGFGEYANAGIYSVSISSGEVGPDLTSSLSLDSTALIVGQTIDVNAQVQNFGTETTDASVIRFYQSTDNIISPADTQIAMHNVAGLAPQGIASFAEQITAPSTAGITYYGVCADAVVNETVTTNNCSSAVEATIYDLDIGDAVEQPGLLWKRGGDNTFFRKTENGLNEGDAAQSGHIDDNQLSFIETDITGPGVLIFNWKVDSEQGFDFLRFSNNGLQVESISGAVDWVEVRYVLGTGVNRLRWEYAKDGSISTGSDAAWIDKVEFYDRVFEISELDASQAEGDSGTVAYQYTIISNGESTVAASVDYAVTGLGGSDSADANDFGGAFPGGTVNFVPNQISHIITVWVSGDTDLEPNEIFQLTLSNPQGGGLGLNSMAQSIIMNDESDIDSDGIKDSDDNCPADANPDQLDADGDLVGNVCDNDNDGDGVDDDEDNCPIDANPDQADICSLCFPVKTPSGTVALICL